VSARATPPTLTTARDQRVDDDSRAPGYLTPLAIVLVAAGSSAVVSLTYNAVVARRLGRVAYSEFAAALAMATMLAYAGGALAPVTAHLSARYMAAGEPAKIRGLVAMVLRRLLPFLALGAAATALVAIPAGRAMHFESGTSLLVAYAVATGLIVLSAARSASRGAQQFGRYGIGLFIECVVRLGGGAILLAIWPHPAAALAAYVIAHGIIFLWTMRDVRALSPTAAPVPFSEFTEILGATTALVVAMAVFQNIDVLLVRRFFTAGDAGVYAAAVSFARWMSMLALPFEALLLPQLTYIGERGHSVVRAAARIGAGFVMLATVPLVLFATVPQLIVTLLYGAEYHEAGPLLLALGLAVFAQYAAYLTVQVLISRSQSWSVWGFVAMGLVENALIISRHDSLRIVTLILATTRLTGLAAILISAWLLAGRRQPDART
jgi:O-antigen/teichoic acid export membrane protein